MAEYILSTMDWVREQVELYEGSGGTEGTTLRDTGLPVIIVTNRGNQTGAIRKTADAGEGREHLYPQRRCAEEPGMGVQPQGGQQRRDSGRDQLYAMRVREVVDAEERTRLWELAVAAFPPYEEYQGRTERRIPVFVAEPV